MKRKALSLILAFAMAVSLFTVGASAAEPTYGDTAGHWAEASIERWSGYGIIQGSNGKFDPDGQLTCAQLATILARLLKLPAAKDAGFIDNPADAWYYDAINRCAAAGILKGNGDGTVTPNASITRERACEVTPDGKIYLTAAGGIAPTICRLADQIIIELNAAHSKNAMGLHDVYEPLDPPYRREIPIYKPSDRIGLPYIQVDPKKIVGVVETNWPDEARSFAAADPLTDKIGQNVADFLAADMKRGIIPSTFLPLQSGVGNIANAVLGALGRDKTIPAFEMYTEVIQNSVIGLIREGRIKFGSACSLTVTNDCLEGIYNDMDFFRDKLVLRPSEISNNPEVVRRLGVISINTAIEVDLYGNVNSTHIGGTKMMNGIGGSGDFTRNAYISIFTCPSVAKEGKISAIVPMVSHLDHSEHSVNIVITEQGVADLRGKSPKERAQAIIENCAHPDYKQLLWDYLKLAGNRAQTPHAIQAALGMHAELAKSGDMKNTNWAEYAK